MTARPRVLVTRTIPRQDPGGAFDRLRATCDVTTWDEDRVMPRDALLDEVTSVDGLYCMLTDRIDAELVGVAERLRVVSQMAVGVDNIDLEACTDRGILVGHTPGVLAGTVADMAISLLLAANRRIVEADGAVRRGEWGAWEPEWLLGRDVSGSTVGIIGFGGVGQEIARRLSGFGCRVLVTNRSHKPAIEEELDVTNVTLDVLLSQSDHVVAAVALTPDTRHLIDADAMARMKPTATLVNIARGGLVDQQALAVALEQGVIARAALDVTDPEPIALDDPLLALDNCLIVPHLGSATVRTRAAMADMAAANLIAGLLGEPMPALANPSAGPT